MFKALVSKAQNAIITAALAPIAIAAILIIAHEDSVSRKALAEITELYTNG
jgi:hypothetical protein